MADEKKPDAAPAAPAEGEAPKGPKVILGFPLPILILVALNALVLLGGFGYIYYLKMVYKSPAVTETQVIDELNKKADLNAKTKTVGDEILLESYAEMIINLRTIAGGKDHYATIEVALECNSDECIQQIKPLRAKIEDIVRMGVASRSYTELASLETKFRLKHEILKEINSHLKNTSVTNLYFTNLVIQ